MSRNVTITATASGADLKIDLEETVTIASPVTLYTDEGAVSFLVDGIAYALYASDTITINGSPFSGTLPQLKTAVEAVFPKSGGASHAPEAYIITESGNNVTINGDTYDRRNAVGSITWDQTATGRVLKATVQIPGYQFVFYPSDTYTIGGAAYVPADAQALLAKMMADVFVPVPAAGVTPKVYAATLYQVGTDAPFPEVLSNTLTSAPVLEYADPGQYSINHPSFIRDKTLIFLGNGNDFHFDYRHVQDGKIYLYTRSRDTGLPANDWLNYSSVRIEVYP